MSAKTAKPADPAPIVRPDPELEITLDGEKRILRMTFGLQKELVRVVGGVDRSAYALMDPDSIDQMMCVALATRDPRGRVTEPYDAEYADISPDDVDRLLQWIQGHVTDFFLRRMATVEKTVGAALPEIERLSSSVNGFRASNSTTQ